MVGVNRDLPAGSSTCVEAHGKPTYNTAGINIFLHVVPSTIVTSYPLLKESSLSKAIMCMYVSNLRH